MFTTAQNVHVEIMTRLNQVNTNRKGAFRPEEIDAAFNTSMFNLIEERAATFKRDTSHENEVKLSDILSDLSVVEQEVQILYNNTSVVNPYCVAVLPVDYYKFEGLDLAINNDCLRVINDVKSKADTTIVSTLEFDINTTTHLSDLKITHNTSSGNTILYDYATSNLGTLNNIQSLFIVINSILNTINNNDFGVEIYWEVYADIYKPNSFIIVEPYNADYINTTLTYSTNTVTSVIKANTTLIFDYESTEFTNIVPTELLSKKTFRDVLSNYYMAKARYKKPLIRFTNNRLTIHFDSRYIPIMGLLTYIKKPIMLNLKSGIMTNFTSHISDVIDLTVSRLSLTLQGDTQSLNHLSDKNV